MAIIKADTDGGLVTSVDWLEQEQSSPSPGLHSALVADLFGKITTQDVFYFACELYQNNDSYSKVLVVMPGMLAIVNQSDLSVDYVNVDSAEVNSLFNVLDTKGLVEFYTGNILIDNPDGSPSGYQLEVYNSPDFGSDLYYVHIEAVGDNTPLFTGLLQGVYLDSPQDIGSYNVKVNQYETDIIVIKSALNHQTNFVIELSDKDSRNYSYQSINQVMYVLDTPKSRKRVNDLVRAKVVTLAT